MNERHSIEGRLSITIDGSRLILENGATVDIDEALSAVQPEDGLDIEDGALVRLTIERIEPPITGAEFLDEVHRRGGCIVDLDAFDEGDA